MFDYETVQLLAQITAVDGRLAPATPEAAALAADMWHRCIGDLDYVDAVDVVAAYYQGQTDRRIMPGDVRSGVMALRAARLKGITDDALMDGVNGWHPRYHQLMVLRRHRAMARPGSAEAATLAAQDAAALPMTEEETAALTAARRQRLTRQPAQQQQRVDGVA